MQTKYYLTFEQVGIIRRIPLKEQDPDMQGILDAFIQAFRIANQMEDNENSMFGIEEFPISAEHASQLM